LVKEFENFHLIGQHIDIIYCMVGLGDGYKFATFIFKIILVVIIE